jgi:hypothetical protein
MVNQQNLVLRLADQVDCFVNLRCPHPDFIYAADRGCVRSSTVWITVRSSVANNAESYRLCDRRSTETKRWVNSTEPSSFRWVYDSGKLAAMLLTGEQQMLMTIAAILLVLWVLGFFAFHIAGGLIHILLVLAVIVFVVNLIRGRSAI